MKPHRAARPFLLGGLLKYETFNKALIAAEGRRGKYIYHVCHSLLRCGKGT